MATLKFMVPIEVPVVVDTSYIAKVNTQKRKWYDLEDQEVPDWYYEEVYSNIKTELNRALLKVLRDPETSRLMATAASDSFGHPCTVNAAPRAGYRENWVKIPVTIEGRAGGRPRVYMLDPKPLVSGVDVL